MGKITIRLAQESDNDSILALAERCPQEGMISFWVNRSPRFNSVHRLLDHDAFHYVACEGERVIGLVGVIHFQASMLGKHCRVAYIMDLRLDNAWRNGTTAFKMIKGATDYLLNGKVDYVIGNFLKDNKRPTVFASGRAGIPKGFHMGDNRVFNIIPLLNKPVDSRYEISSPTEADLPELVRLYTRYTASYRMAPVYSEDRLRFLLKNLQGFSLENFLVARQNGVVKAVTAVWDENNYKSYQVTRLNSKIKIANALLKAMSMVIKVPAPIRVNQPLKQKSLILYAHDNNPVALTALFKEVNNRHRGTDYTLLTLYAQERDPVFECIKDLQGIDIKSEMYLFCQDTSKYEPLAASNLPDLLDISLTV
jgi:hypothetical protein